MKQRVKIIVPVMLLISLQVVFGQNNQVEIPVSAKMFQTIENSGYDLIVRINSDMNDEELMSRIDVLNHFDAAIKIDYARDKSGNIRTLSSSDGRSSCKSDNFGFLIIGFKDGKSNGCMISDKK